LPPAGGARALPVPAGCRDGLLEARRQLEAYFAAGCEPSSCPLECARHVVPLQVWEALRAIPYGVTISYSSLRAASGRPSAAARRRPGGGAEPSGQSSSPVHRVVGSGGALTGFAWGIERKRRCCWQFEAGCRECRQP